MNRILTCFIATHACIFTGAQSTVPRGAASTRASRSPTPDHSIHDSAGCFLPARPRSRPGILAPRCFELSGRAAASVPDLVPIIFGAESLDQ